MIITGITSLDKGKAQVSFDAGKPLILYKSELRKFSLEELGEIDDSIYEQLYYEIVGKRAMKRAMHLLERMDRTEWQLRRKLEEGNYPQELIDRAVDYVKSYRYIDDDRYARTFIRLNQARKSRNRIKMDLISRGICRDIIEHALEEENEMPQAQLIRKLLEKKNYNKDTASPQETKKMYQYLMRKGFRSDEIIHHLRYDTV